MALLIDTEDLPIPRTRHEIKCEVHTRQKHENGSHILQIWGIEVGEIGLMRTESTRTDGCHGMAYRIIKRHRSEEVKQGTNNSQHSVYEEDTPGRLLRLRAKLTHGNAGRLRGEQLRIVSVIRGKQSDGEQHDAQSSHPLLYTAPEEDSVRLLLDIVQNGSPRRREAGHRLEEGIRHRIGRPINHERKHSEKGKDHPCSGYDDITILPGQRPFILSIGPKEESAAGTSHARRHQQSKQIRLAVTERDDSGNRHEHGLHQKENAKNLFFHLITSTPFKETKRFSAPYTLSGTMR